MVISFSCPECGRKLKAPDEAVGRSLKCPGCESPVTCPEPIYDAELIDGPPARVDMPAGVDSEPLQAVGDAPLEVAESGPQVRRPCPMCGEMIVATAVKCRFCGEILDDTLRISGVGGSKGKAGSFETARKNLLICMFLVLGCIFASAGLQARVTKNSHPALTLVLPVVGVTYLGASLAGMVYTFMLTKTMSSTGVGILVAILALVPCLGLLIALLVYQRALEYGQDTG
jgi:predicted RNA-binding Zn-ribbon protein involved in translation (DUF1610 family)